MFTQILFFLISIWHQTRKIRSYLFPFSKCRFYPSCSDYCIHAIKKFGLYEGGVLTLKRLIRCHPLCEGGIDEIH